MTCLWERAKDLRLVKVSCLWCSLAKSGLPIYGQWLTIMVQFQTFSVYCYHLGWAESKCTLWIFSFKRLVVAMNATYQEEDILTSEGIRKLKTMKNSRGSEMLKRLSYHVNWNLKLNECTVWAVAKFGRFTLWLVHSKRCRPGFTHAVNIFFQLLRCTSSKVAGPHVSWDMKFYSL